ncbi:MAG: hypothetical protein QG622_236 [Actinomycetota bacterium]|nr:hypothetical protein [Actinomycetota bacterium]
MGRPFRRIRAGIRVQLEAPERALLARLLDDVGGLLDEEATRRDGLPSGGGAPGGDPSDDVLAALEASLTMPPPEDPAIARLLPDGNRDDPELAAGYRRLTEHGLRERKRAGLGMAAEALSRDAPVVLTSDEVPALLKGLTDVRLVLAERLGLRTDEDVEELHRALTRANDPEDPRTAVAAIYDALTWWQESLIAVLR